MNIILNSLLYGLDSFFLGLVVGAFSPSRSWPWIAAAFGLADGLAGLAGHAVAGFGAPTWAGACAPTLLAGYAAFLFLAAQRLRALATRRFGLAILPVVLSLDNFIGAAALPTSAWSFYGETATMALASFLMAFAGCSFGGALAGRAPRLVWPLAGGASLAAAAAMTLS